MHFCSQHHSSDSAFRLTQINTVHVGAPLLGYVDVQVEEAQRVSEVLPGTGVQHQHGIMGRGLGERLLVPVGPLGSVQPLAQAEASSSSFGAQQGGRGVGQDGQNFLWVPWKVLAELWNGAETTELPGGFSPTSLRLEGPWNGNRLHRV